MTWSSFLKEVMENFILAAMSFRFFVTPGSWTESSSPTEFSPDRTRSLSRSDQRASVEISHQKHLCFYCPELLNIEDLLLLFFVSLIVHWAELSAKYSLVVCAVHDRLQSNRM